MRRQILAVFTVAMLAIGTMGISAFAETPKTVSETEKVQERTVQVKDEVYIVKEKKKTYYVSEESGLNIRKLPDKETELLGCLEYGEEVKVTGFVYKEENKDGEKVEKKTGWVEITFLVDEDDTVKEKTGYIREELSEEYPGTKTSNKDIKDSTEQTEYETEAEYAQCPYCGDWYETGVSYRSHVTACQSNTTTTESQQSYECIICGAWYSDYNEFMSHAAMCIQQDYLTCPYCGNSYHQNGGAYDFHVASCPSNPTPSAYVCPNCYTIMNYDEQYTHVCP